MMKCLKPKRREVPTEPENIRLILLPLPLYFRSVSIEKPHSCEIDTGNLELKLRTFIIFTQMCTIKNGSLCDIVMLFHQIRHRLIEIFWNIVKLKIIHEATPPAENF